VAEFEDMSAGEILEWLRNHYGWSRDCFEDEILPVLRRKVAELEGTEEGEEQESTGCVCTMCGWLGEKTDCIPGECDTLRCPECKRYISSTLGEV